MVCLCLPFLQCLLPAHYSTHARDAFACYLTNIHLLPATLPRYSAPNMPRLPHCPYHPSLPHPNIVCVFLYTCHVLYYFPLILLPVLDGSHFAHGPSFNPHTYLPLKLGSYYHHFYPVSIACLVPFYLIITICIVCPANIVVYTQYLLWPLCACNAVLFFPYFRLHKFWVLW